MPEQISKDELAKHNVEKHNRPWRLKFHLPLHSSSNKPKKTPNQTPSRSPSPNAASKRLDFTKDIPTNIPYPPFVNVEGVPNFRDLGGYACGRPPNAPSESDQEFSIRSGYAFRCSELSQITPLGDTTLVVNLGIRIMYDLRSEKEAENPKGRPEGVVIMSTPVYRRENITMMMGIQQLQWSTAPDKRGAGYSEGYVNWYRQILEQGAKYAYRIIFEHIRDQPDDPFVYHCTAGKDRTGVLSAVILKLCGVDNRAVAWEYSLTVPGMGVWEEAVEQEMVGDSMMPIRSHGGMTREEARRVCGSRAANMEHFLTIVLDGEFGGAAKYLKDHCGFSDADVDVIRSHLIVPGKATVKPVTFPGYEDHLQT